MGHRANPQFAGIFRHWLRPELLSPDSSFELICVRLGIELANHGPILDRYG
jgi:hypothetical protein